MMMVTFLSCNLAHVFVLAANARETRSCGQADTPSVKLESLVKSIMGSARSMGIDVTWE